MLDFASISIEEQRDFFTSFDEILSDIDGVIWFGSKPIEGAVDCLNNLRELGKKVHFVSNNSRLNVDQLCNKLLRNGLKVDCNDLVIPATAVIQYLKEITFDKSIFLIGLPAFKEQLQLNNFTVVENQTTTLVDDNLLQIEQQFSDDDPEIGAVIIGFDLNFNFFNFMKAMRLVRRQNVIFITLDEDVMHLLNEEHQIIGSKFYIEQLRKHTGRQSISFVKPSQEYNNFICRKYNIKNPSKILFIGDTIEQDMLFASNCGYKKLLVLSGNTSLETIENWPFEPNLKPDYFIKSLGELNEILNKNIVI